MVNSLIKKRILVILAMLAFLFSGIISYTNSSVTAQAGHACSSLGSGLSQQNVGGVFQGSANPDSAGRKWTAEELFRNSVGFSTYYGEGPSTWWYADTSDRGSGTTGYDNVKSKIEEARGCTTFDFIPNSLLWISGVITAITGSIVLTLVGKDPMAETLMKIVGGDGESGGLIETFLSSFYMPLVVITVVIMAATIIYKGLIQFKFREALNSMIWTFGAFIIGLALMLNPQILVGAPQAATSTITTCVLGALSGQNCLTGDVTTPDILTGKECISNVASEGSDAESVVNSLNCTVWKSFVLEPWAEVQFGAPYNELYTKNEPDGGKIWRNLPDEEGAAEKYCVNFTSESSYSSSISSGKPVMNGTKEEVCNVALYHLFVKTNMDDPVSQGENSFAKGWTTDESGSYDKRWYDIIVPMANDNSSWRNWIGKDQIFNRTGSALMGMIATIAASTVLLTLAVFAGAYKVTGLILMAFAPVFFLFAIEPNRGRRIFLGWLETLISTILKYFAITVLIIVALVMYSGMLSNTSGAMSFVGIVILTAALHMYRKEIVDLIGVSNMGGQKLSNKAAEIGNWAAKQTKDKTSAAVGGMVGGSLASRSIRKEDLAQRKETIEDLKAQLDEASSPEQREAIQKSLDAEEAAAAAAGTVIGAGISGAFSGGAESVGRSFKRGTGLAANIAQQAGRTKAGVQASRDKVDKEADARRKQLERLSHFNEDTIATPNKNVGPIVNSQGKTVLRDEYNAEIEENLEKIGPPQFMNDDLSMDEKEALKEFADKFRTEKTDKELVEMLKSEEVLNDPRKHELVNNEIKARIQANNNLNIESLPLESATAVERGLVENKDLAQKLNMFEAQFINTYSAHDHEEMLNAYTETLYQADIPKDDVEMSTKALVESHAQNNEIAREKLMKDIDKKQYEKIAEYTKDKGQVSEEEIMKEFKVDSTTAKKTMDVMEIDQIVDSPEEEGVRKVVNKPTVDKDEDPPADNGQSGDKDEVPKAKTKVESPKAETKVESPKAETKVESPKAEAKVESPKTETRVETPKAEAKVESPKTETRVETPKAEERIVIPPFNENLNEGPVEEDNNFNYERLLDEEDTFDSTLEDLLRDDDRK